jgi:asparagine synthase (glutamine-hydrolysing)
MCGIAGAVGTRSVKELASEVSRAIASLEHRGPDGSGQVALDAAAQSIELSHREEVRGSWTTASAANGSRSCVLAHRRLAILDLSEDAAQPMASQDGQYFLLHNGEIYNFVALRKQLQDAGHRFKTNSDSEVLLAGYAEWGKDVVQRLEGMFAFAILDMRRRVLFLARDAFGMKPLYYTTRGSDFAFASEPSALLQFSWVSRQANASKVFEHLNHWTTDATENTFFAAIRSLPAAHFLEVPLCGEVAHSPVRYWDIPADKDNRITLPEAAEVLRETFKESVALHLQSDVPWCIALSGGQDSSSITMMARRILGDDPPLHTVSYIADQPQLNEEIWIDAVNHAAKATAHKLHIKDDDLGRDFKDLVRVQCQPMVTPVVYAQHRVFRHAREQGFKVLLEGQGADELLAGYPFYLQARLASLVKKGNWISAAQFLFTAPPKFLTGRRHVLSHAIRRAFPGWVKAKQPIPKAKWISEPWAKQKNVWDDAAPFDPLSRPGGHYLREMIYDAVTQTKLPSLLRYGDHNAMAASVENRTPFLTRKLAEFLFSLPEEYILANDGTTKKVFREAMRGITPELVLRRKNKIGFEPPYAAWMQAMMSQLDDSLACAQDLKCFHPEGVAAVRRQIKEEGIKTAAFANRVWRIASLAEWARQFDVGFD